MPRPSLTVLPAMRQVLGGEVRQRYIVEREWNGDLSGCEDGSSHPWGRTQMSLGSPAVSLAAAPLLGSPAHFSPERPPHRWPPQPWALARVPTALNTSFVPGVPAARTCPGRVQCSLSPLGHRTQAFLPTSPLTTEEPQRRERAPSWWRGLLKPTTRPSGGPACTERGGGAALHPDSDRQRGRMVAPQR